MDRRHGAGNERTFVDIIGILIYIQSLGQPGRVIRIFSSGDCRVSVNGRNWTFNPLCLRAAPDEDPPPAVDDIDNGSLIPELAGMSGLDDDGDFQLKLLALLGNPATIVAAAAGNNLEVLRNYLTSHPSDVNHKASNKTALHCAASSGNIPIIKCLLEFKANLEVEVSDIACFVM
jgi:E3 ubiquitin-protein ligase mind-bomb